MIKSARTKISAILLALSMSMQAAAPSGFTPVESRRPVKTARSINPELPALAGAKAATGEINAYANIWYRASWEESGAAYGVYSFPIAEGTYSTFPTVTADQQLCGNAGAVYANGKYFVATAEEVNAPNGGYVVMSMKFLLFDTATWTATEIPDADEEFKAMDMAYDPMTDLVYGCFVKRGADGYYYFGTLDIATGRVTTIKNYGQSSDYAFTGIAASDGGDIYGINASGRLCLIDKTTGETTTIGETGLTDQYATTAAYDPSTARIYYALNTDGLQGMYEINPANAVAKRLYSFQDEESLAGMYFPDAPVSADAPAAPQELEATFTDGSLSGNVSFTLPSLTIGGSALSGTVNYTVKLNGVETASGSGQSGSRVNVPVTAPSAAEYSVSVVCSTAAGNGPASRMRIFIGEDRPMPVENVVLTHSDGTFTLTWDNAKAIHGGYMNPAALSYSITRYPDGATFSTSSTQFTQTLPEPETRTRYRYSVATTLNGFTTEPTESNTVITGTYKAPVTFGFDSRDCLDDIVLTDGDSDGKTWVWADGQMHSSICLTRNVDDWLILPPVQLERGKSYRISVEAKATRSPVQVYPERIAIWAGESRSREAMTRQILEPTDITTDKYTVLSADYSPEKDGPCYFAVQGCSDIDKYYLWIDNFSVSEPVASHVPQPVSDFSAVAAAGGQLKATLTFTMPTADMSGDPLGEVTRTEIFRDNEPIATVTAQKGETVTYEDASAHNGENIYGVEVTTAAGTSLRQSASVYVGVHQPAGVTGLEALRGSDNGEIVLRWDAALTDTAGTALGEGSVTYKVIRYDRNVTTVAENLTSTSFTDRIAQNDTPQEFVQYAVTASNIAGESEDAYSNTTTYGLPHSTPATESFAGGATTYEFVVERADDNASWTSTSDSSTSGVESQDNDGGLLRFIGVTTGDRADFISGTFDISALENPALTFYYYYPRGTERGISVTLFTKKDGRLSSVSAEATPQPGLEGWQRCIVPLREKTDRLQFVLTGENFGEYATTIFIDNIALLDLPTPNVTFNKLNVPAVAEACEPFEITAHIENSGIATADATVNLFLNGENIGSKTVSLESCRHAAVTFSHTFGTVNPEQLVIYAEVTTPDDKIAADNRSKEIEIGVHHNIYPAPVAESALPEGNSVKIEWTRPDLGPDEPETVTDDVESYPAFSIGLRGSELAGDYLGQWTSLDADGLYTIGVGHGTEAIPNATVPKAFMAFNGREGNMTGDAWQAHSGYAMFAAFSAIADYGSGNDDWLISPLLPGNAQQITFFARSATDLYGLESMEVLCSSTGTEAADFTPVVPRCEVPSQWTEYTASLPEGTRYFAIRCTSSNLFALLVDDITFTRAGFRGMGVELLGYNIYRNYSLLNSEPVTTESFTDTNPGDNSDTFYHITAVYNTGESRPSEKLIIGQTGVGEISQATVEVTAANGEITVEHAEGLQVRIAAPDGRLLYSGVARATVRVKAVPGTYIVAAGTDTFKVALR